ILSETRGAAILSQGTAFMRGARRCYSLCENDVVAARPVPSYGRAGRKSAVRRSGNAGRARSGDPAMADQAGQLERATVGGRVAAPGAVAVVIVNWNGWRDTVECLESLFRGELVPDLVIVCDNESSDGSMERIREWAAGA